MNRYFGTGSHKSSKEKYAQNKTLAGVRAAILQNKSMLLGTSNPEKWHTLLRTEFPDVGLRIVENGVMINEKS
jgi:hypothetical protein